MPETRRALIYPEQRRIACVLMQAMYGGDSSVPSLFDTNVWQYTPREGGRMVTGTWAEWRTGSLGLTTDFQHWLPTPGWVSGPAILKTREKPCTPTI